MSKLIDQLNADILRARKARSADARVLLTLKGSLDTASKSFNPPRAMTDADVVAEVRKLLKGLDEMGNYATGEKLEQVRIEQAALAGYLPAQMSEDEIRAFTDTRVAAGENMGQIMAALKSEHPGAYDGKTASAIVKDALAKT